MKRFHEELTLMNRRKKCREFWDRDLPFSWKYSLGTYRKTRPFGCRNTRCLHCHGDKYPKRHPTKQERQSAEELTICDESTS